MTAKDILWVIVFPLVDIADGTAELSPVGEIGDLAGMIGNQTFNFSQKLNLRTPSRRFQTCGRVPVVAVIADHGYKIVSVCREEG